LEQSLHRNHVGFWLWPQFHTTVVGSLSGIKGFVRPIDGEHREWIRVELVTLQYQYLCRRAYLIFVIIG
jgi:hypothetical protein